MPNLRVLSLQPFYGGSHKAFIDGWLANSQHEWTECNLPGRFWKWRMRHAAVEFSNRLNGDLKDVHFDVFFCTDMLNVAEFRGLLRVPHHQRTPCVVYFHENQAAYPNQEPKERDLHFVFTNFTSMLAADEVWYNSQFNHDSFIEEFSILSRHWPDYRPAQAIKELETKGFTAYPGIEDCPVPACRLTTGR